MDTKRPGGDVGPRPRQAGDQFCCIAATRS